MDMTQPPASFADLLKQRDAIEAQIKVAREAETERLSVKWHAEAAVAGLSVTEVLNLPPLARFDGSPTMTATNPARRAEKGPPSQSGWQRGVTYAHPSDTHDGTWIGGAKGRQPLWLREFIAGGFSWESLAVNPT
jgi:hypothetical protein